MQKYKHGEKIYNWRYKWDYVRNPDYNPNRFFSGPEFNVEKTDVRVYYGDAYRFRMDPVIGGWRRGNWTKFSNKGSGKCWKREWYAARVDAKVIYEDYGITFKNSKRIDFKHGYNQDRSWKRSKKKKQWM
jgi:hypothetical protein